MTTLIRRLATDVAVPLVIDSTEFPVLESALKLAGGRCVINSVNLEDGEERTDRIFRLAKRFGAALIALTIDEEGMAKTTDRKVAVARRLAELAIKRHGLRATDLIFDPLTFTICTGNEADRRLGLETLDSLAQIKLAIPGSHTVLGLSNISFGIAPACRHVLNSVFLHLARERGLDAAILHVSGIRPLFRIHEDHRQLADDLIFDRRREGYDPLQELIRAFADVQAAVLPEKSNEKRPVEERLKRRIIDGNRVGLEEDLEDAMLQFRPLDIINDFLLDGMKTVGDLFGAGQMQLPFVLQSAETMKAAVAYLQPFMDRNDEVRRGSIVLATVRGDVHDIGKNLVDIILTNNGYQVYNLGIKQPINSILDAFIAHDADAIGMSGLLVKSTVVMRENLSVMNDRGLTPPVILGGAALTRRYVEQILRPEYRGQLHYAKDAFEGLRLMGEISANENRVLVDAGGSAIAEAEPNPADENPTLDEDALADARPMERRSSADDVSLSHESLKSMAGQGLAYTPPRSDISRDVPIPTSPFWGSCVVDRIEPRAALAYLNENMLFQVQWQYRKNRRSPSEFKRYIDLEVRPILRELLGECERGDILQPKAVYGFWPAQADGDSLIVYDPNDRERQLEVFEFPRQRKPPYRCLSDFFRPVESGELDVVAFSMVTAGQRVSEVARHWFAENRYRDYLHLHGLGVELAEALAEYIHKQMRVQWGIAGQDAREKQEIFKQRYQGSRYSFGYPACPRLEDQLKLWPLLQPERIGISLSEEFQLDPEQSTSALIVHHHQAKYFNVR